MTHSPCRDCDRIFCPWPPHPHRPDCRQGCPLLAEFRSQAAANRDSSYGVADPTDDEGYSINLCQN